MTPLRIVHLAATPSGAPWLVRIVREQQRRGHEVLVILNGRDGTLAPIFERQGVPVHIASLGIAGHQSLIAIARDLYRMARLLRRLRPDVVQYHMMPALIVARLAAWLVDAPLRFAMIPGPYYLEAPVYGDIEAGTAWAETKVIATCERTRTLYVERGVDRSHVELAYYGLDDDQFDPARADGARVRRELGVSSNQPVIGMVAYFYPPTTEREFVPLCLVGRAIKAPDVLLRAVPRVLQRFPDAKVVLVGQGWGPGGEEHRCHMMTLAKELGVRDAVFFVGERADVPDVLAALDVALQCSRCENLGGTIEALMMAKPLIATRTGGLIDSVIHERTGLLVPIDDAGELGDAIVRLLEDRDFARQLGEAGRRFMLDRFSLGRTVDDLERFYNRGLADDGLGEGRPHLRRYRLHVMVLRALLLPVRVAPLALEFQAMRLLRCLPMALLDAARRLFARRVPPHETLAPEVADPAPVVARDRSPVTAPAVMPPATSALAPSAVSDRADWLPPGKRAAVCMSVDDVHPASDGEGRDRARTALEHVRRLQIRHPRLKVTLFTTPDWRSITPVPTERLLIRLPVVRHWIYGVPVLPRGTKRLDRQPEFCRYLREWDRTEIAIHGLHHVCRGMEPIFEFAGKSVARCRTMLRSAVEIFSDASLPLVMGVAPPGGRRQRRCCGR